MPVRSSKYSPAQTSLLEPIYVDGFAGGGEWSTGFELACGRAINVAINHSEDAVLMHKTNHPYTEHYCESIFSVSPRAAVRGRHVRWAHFSPDCTHFSKAKGGKPKKKEIRGLAWVVLRWAGEVRPDIISLENVEEFLTWGPLRRGKPRKSRVGETFRQWKRQLEALGYVIEYKVLVASDYGAPTSRKRLFVIARRDGQPIVWPEATHGDPKTSAVKAGELKPWRTAADIIDWKLPTPSIFATKEEIKEKYNLKAVRPLADNTMKRIIRGVDKFVLKAEDPYIMSMDGERITAPSVTIVNHKGEFRGLSVEEPLQTITGKHGYGIASPTLSPIILSNTENAAGRSLDTPIGTVTTGGSQMEVVPVMMAIGQTGSSSDRCRRVDSPINTTVSKAETCIVAPTIVQYHSEQSEDVRGQDIDKPLNTVDTANRHAFVAPHLCKYYGSDEHGQDVDTPLHTVTARDREGIVNARLEEFPPDEAAEPFIAQNYAGGYTGAGSDIKAPLPTVTAIDHNSLVSAHVVKMKGENLGQGVDTPVQTVTASGTHFGVVTTKIIRVRPGDDLHNWPKVRTLLNEHCGYEIAEDEVLLIGLHGAWYYICDIGLRMLSSRELYSANGFPEDYIIERDYLGRPYGKTKQVARCGNAVPPPFATAIVRANIPEICVFKLDTMADLFERVAV